MPDPWLWLIIGVVLWGPVAVIAGVVFGRMATDDRPRPRSAGNDSKSAPATMPKGEKPTEADVTTDDGTAYRTMTADKSGTKDDP